MFNNDVLEALKVLKEEQIILTKKHNKRLRKIQNDVQSLSQKIDALSQLIYPTQLNPKTDNRADNQAGNQADAKLSELAKGLDAAGLAGTLVHEPPSTSSED